MSQEAVERVLGRLLTDEGFRRSAKESLEVACVQQGYMLTTTELSLLSGLKLQAINEVAAQLNPGLCRAVMAKEINQNRNYSPSVQGSSSPNAFVGDPEFKL